MNQWLMLLVVALVLWFAHGGVAYAQEPAGFVLMAAGDVQALQTNDSYRKLRRKSPFYPGETLVVGEKAKAQVRFSDGSLISLRPGTQIRIDEYRFNEHDKGDDRNIFTLLNGGFRTITGKIGKKNPDNYQMKSAVASIGVRGTTYEVVLGNELSVAAWRGTIVVENEAGNISLGVDGLYNFAVVSSSTSLPRGLMSPPKAITSEREIAPELEGGNGQSEGQTDEAAAEDSGSEPGSSLAEDVNSEREQEGGIWAQNARDTGDESPLPSYTGDEVTTLVSEFGDGGDQATPFEQDPTTDTTVDLRVDGLTLDRLAMAVSGGTTQVGMLAGGAAGYDGNGSLVIADNGLSPDQAGFGTTPYLKVLAQNSATLLNSGTIAVETGYDVNWGIWTGSATTPALLMTDATDPTIGTNVVEPIYWAESAATPVSALTSRTGTTSYQNVLGFIGGGNSGDISQFYLSLNVNFDTLTATGTGSIVTPGELWHLSLNGTLSAPILDFTTVGGDVNGQAISGEFASLFIGSTGQALLSSFDLQAAADPTIHVEGLAVVDQTPISDLRVAGLTLDRIAMAVSGGTTQQGMWAGGKAGYDGNGNLVIADNGFGPDQPEFNTAPYLKVIGKGSAALAGSGTFTVENGYDVKWGVWSGSAATPIVALTDPADLTATSNWTETVYWAESAATPLAALGTRSGSVNYQNVLGFVGGGTSGAVNNVYLSLNVDFTNATATAVGSIATPSELWHLSLSGNINAQTLDFVNVGGDVNGQAINGEFSGLFIGANGGAILNSFDLQAAADPTLHVEGLVVAGEGISPDLRLTAAELATIDRVGIGIVNDGQAGSNWILGTASNNGSGSPIIIDKGYSLSDPLLINAPAVDVLRQGNATIIGTPYANGTYPVYWGTWSSGAQVQQTGYDPLSAVDLANGVRWITVVPTSATNLAGLTGLARFSPIFAEGSDQNGTSMNFISMGLAFDFNTAAFAGSGTVEPVANGGHWDFMFDGSLNQAELVISTIDAKVIDVNGNASAANAYLNLLLTGTGGNAAAGAFELELASNPTQFVSGTILLGQDQRLSATELAVLDRVGFGIESGTAAGAHIMGGLSSDGSGANAIVTDNSFLWGDSRFKTAPVLDVLRKGTATDDLAPNTHGTLPVSWGTWSAGAGVQSQSQDAAAVTTLTNPVLWLTAIPTTNTVLSGMTGRAYYMGSSSYHGQSSAGPSIYWSPLMLSLNYDTGAFEGHLKVDVFSGTKLWDVAFDGQMVYDTQGNKTAGLKVGNTSVMYTQDLGSSNYSTAVGSGTVDLLLTGDTQTGVAAVYDLELASDPATYVQGTQVAELDTRLTAGELSLLDHHGFFVASNTGATSYALATPADNATQSPVIVDPSGVYRLPTITDQTRATSYTVGGDATFTVNWGDWNGTYEQYWDPANAGSKNSYSVAQAHWLTFMPTPADVIATKTGTITYNVPMGVLGHTGFTSGPAITANSLAFNATLNFDTNAMSGNMSFTEGANLWSITNFTGNLTPTGYVAVDSLTGIGPGGTVNNTATSMAVTGPNAQGLVGQFDWTTASDAAKGVFLVCQTGGC